jgi:hypothetical protein
LAFIALLDIGPKLALLNHMLIQCAQLDDLETHLTSAQHDTLLPEVHVELVGVEEVVVHLRAELALHVVFLLDRRVGFSRRFRGDRRVLRVGILVRGGFGAVGRL